MEQEAEEIGELAGDFKRFGSEAAHKLFYEIEDGILVKVEILASNQRL